MAPFAFINSKPQFLMTALLLFIGGLCWAQPQSGMMSLEKKLQSFKERYDLDAGLTQFSKSHEISNLSPTCSLQFFTSQSDPNSKSEDKFVVVFSHPGIMMGSYIFSGFYFTDGNDERHQLVLGVTLSQMRSDESSEGLLNIYDITTFEDDFGLMVLGSQMNSFAGLKRYACFFSKK